MHFKVLTFAKASRQHSNTDTKHYEHPKHPVLRLGRATKRVDNLF